MTLYHLKLYTPIIILIFVHIILYGRGSHAYGLASVLGSNSYLLFLFLFVCLFLLSMFKIMADQTAVEPLSLYLN